MNAAVRRYTTEVVVKRGWIPGSSLENRFALLLHRIGMRNTDLVQQHSVGKYRIDFADPDVLIGIEADGFYHQMPGAQERDRERDAWLLTQGWYLIRIADDLDEKVLQYQLFCAVLLLREERRHQGLPWKREPTSSRNKKPKPSRLAYIAGYRYPT